MMGSTGEEEAAMDTDGFLAKNLFILVYSDQRSCAIRPAIPKVSGHRSRSIRPSFLSIRPTAGTSRLECTMN